MPHSAYAIANYFLDKALSTGKQLTQIHVQKLVFYSHGWHLALDEAGRPLIAEPIEAWRYGPVVRSLYREFAEFGSNPINRKARDVRAFRTADGRLGVSMVEPSIDNEQPNDINRELVIAILDRAWEIYGNLSAYQLSNMTHAENEPWQIIQKAFGEHLPRGLNIPNETIRDCFRQKLQGQPGS